MCNSFSFCKLKFIQLNYWNIEIIQIQYLKQQLITETTFNFFFQNEMYMLQKDEHS